MASLCLIHRKILKGQHSAWPMWRHLLNIDVLDICRPSPAIISFHPLNKPISSVADRPGLSGAQGVPGWQDFLFKTGASRSPHLLGQFTAVLWLWLALGTFSFKGSSHHNRFLLALKKFIFFNDMRKKSKIFSSTLNVHFFSLWFEKKSKHFSGRLKISCAPVIMPTWLLGQMEALALGHNLSLSPFHREFK